MAPKNCLDFSNLHPYGVSTSSHSISKSPASSCDPSHSSLKPSGRRITPVVRVVQIFAPKRIETDVANFRALVQELTGNSSSSDREGTANSDKPRKGNAHKKRKASCSEATPTDRQKDTKATVSAHLHDSMHETQHLEQPIASALPGASQNADGPAATLSFQQRVNYAHSSAHQDNANADARPMTNSAACSQVLPVSRSYAVDNSDYLDPYALFNTDLDIISSLSIFSKSNLPEMDQLTALTELAPVTPMYNTCHDYKSVLQPQISWRLPVPPVFQYGIDQF